jgi:hypothetical protein
MLFIDAWDLLAERVFPVPSTERLFNPYLDIDPELDRPGAQEIRRRNLRNYLSAYTERPRLFLLLEAPGPWGCRFSGVPITSEAQLVDPSFPISGTPSSARPEPYSEYSAGIYWRILMPYFPHFFTWNTVPLHPHRPGEPLSIRNPTQREVGQFVDVAADMVRIVRPEHVLAVGRKAEYALRQAGLSCSYVRHPSQGGAGKFAEGIRAAFTV